MQRAQFTMQLNDISSICAMCSSTFALCFLMTVCLMYCSGKPKEESYMNTISDNQSNSNNWSICERMALDKQDDLSFACNFSRFYTVRIVTWQRIFILDEHVLTTG